MPNWLGQFQIGGDLGLTGAFGIRLRGPCRARRPWRPGDGLGVGAACGIHRVVEGGELALFRGGQRHGAATRLAGERIGNWRITTFKSGSVAVRAATSASLLRQ
jgi:hypothetical protein